MPRAPPSNRSRIVATSSVRISTGTVSAARSVENVSTGPAGLWRTGMNVVRSAITASTWRPVTKVVRSSQWLPMSPTARSAPPAVDLEPPVPVGVVEQPVLEVAAGHQPHVAHARRPRTNRLTCWLSG